MKVFIGVVVAVLGAVALDLSAWTASAEAARKEGRELPPFDWKVAGMRWLTGLAAGLGASLSMAHLGE